MFSGVSDGVTSLRLPTKQLVWKAGEPPLAASRRRPEIDCRAAVKVCAGKASTLKPWPAGLLTRENAAYGCVVSLSSKVYRKPNWLPASSAGQISRRLAKVRALSAATVKDGQSSGPACEVPSPG